MSVLLPQNGQTSAVRPSGPAIKTDVLIAADVGESFDDIFGTMVAQLMSHVNGPGQHSSPFPSSDTRVSAEGTGDPDPQNEGSGLAISLPSEPSETLGQNNNNLLSGRVAVSVPGDGPITFQLPQVATQQQDPSLTNGREDPSHPTNLNVPTVLSGIDPSDSAENDVRSGAEKVWDDQRQMLPSSLPDSHKTTAWHSGFLRQGDPLLDTHISRRPSPEGQSQSKAGLDRQPKLDAQLYGNPYSKTEQDLMAPNAARHERDIGGAAVPMRVADPAIAEPDRDTEFRFDRTFSRQPFQNQTSTALAQLVHRPDLRGADVDNRIPPIDVASEYALGHDDKPTALAASVGPQTAALASSVSILGKSAALPGRFTSGDQGKLVSSFPLNAAPHLSLRSQTALVELTGSRSTKSHDAVTATQLAVSGSYVDETEASPTVREIGLEKSVSSTSPSLPQTNQGQWLSSNVATGIADMYRNQLKLSLFEQNRPTEKLEDLPFSNSIIETRSASMSITSGLASNQPLGQQTVAQITQSAVSNPNGTTRLILDPEELGKVTFSMSSDERSITLYVLADRPETMDLLRRNIEQLAQELRSLGYEEVSFQFGGQGHQSSQSDQSAPQFHQDWTTDEGQPSDQPRSRANGQGQLDIRL